MAFIGYTLPKLATGRRQNVWIACCRLLKASMALRFPKSLWTSAFHRTLGAMTRTTLRASTKALVKAVRPVAKAALKPIKAIQPVKQVKLVKQPVKPPPVASDWVLGIAVAGAVARRYRLYKPPTMLPLERLPLLVMLHGCQQDANDMALSTRMNRLAARERFLVIYPDQDRIANPQRCWNWYDTRNGRAQAEAAAIMAAVDQVSMLYPVDPARIAVAGLSAGASMAALLATRYPQRFRAVAMHSGVPPGAANSTASALASMRGRGSSTPLDIVGLPPLLVIHGSADPVVDLKNGLATAQLWAVAAGARATAPRQVQRGNRYPMTVTDYRHRRKVVASLCEISGLAHAWSGGAAGEPFTDVNGPDASRLVWAFAKRQFGR